jgi:hypothetical protein
MEDQNEKAFLDAINAQKELEAQEMQQQEVAQDEQQAQEEQPETPQAEQEEQATEEVEETQEEAERTEEQEEVVNEEEEEDVLIFGDDDEEEAVEGQVNTQAFDATMAEKLKEVGLEVTSQDQLVETIKQLKQKADSAETVFASEEIRVANDILKQGGNWQEYLQVSSTDWDAFPDEQLVMWELERDFGSKDEAQEAFDEMSEIMRKRDAKRIRNEQKLIQSEQKVQIADKARKVQESFVSGVKNALKEIDTIGKVKVNDKAKAKLEKMMFTYDEKLRANEMQKKYFLNEKGEPDYKKMMQSIAKLEFYDKLEEVALKQGRTAGKREVIDRVSNVSNPRQNQTVQDVATRKPLTTYESITERLKKGEHIQGF